MAGGWSCPQGGSLGEGADLATLPAVSLGGPALGLKLVSPPHQKCGVPWSLLWALSDTSCLQRLQLQICPPPAPPLSQAAEGVSRDCSVGEFWIGPLPHGFRNSGMGFGSPDCAYWVILMAVAVSPLLLLICRGTLKSTGKGISPKSLLT